MVHRRQHLQTTLARHAQQNHKTISILFGVEMLTDNISLNDKKAFQVKNSSRAAKAAACG